MIQLFPKSGAQGQHMANRVAYYRELAERLAQMPGMEAVSYSHMGPLLSYEYKVPVRISSSNEQSAQAVDDKVGPGFFRLIGMRLLAGREFDWRDDETAQRVAIISESLARRLFPSENPIGKRIDSGDRKDLEIVGIVNSASLWMPQSREPMAVYTALMQEPAYNSSHIDIRTTGDPAAIAPAVNRILDSLGRHFALRTQTLEQRADMFLATDCMIAMLSSFFGGLALLLASIGQYGLMSYVVAGRTSEIGIRMALGAQRGSVLRLIIREALWLTVPGIVLGILAALAASRLISGIIFGLSATDPLSITVSSLLLLVVSILAGYFPARRASRIDPMTALRSE